MISETRKIVRAVDAGVFFGDVVEQDGRTVTIENARRIWFWAGAATLSELATRGTTRPGDCKFPCSVERVVVFDVCEILDVTVEAGESIDSVSEWRA